MGGNRKHGFMRSSAAGRNGFGLQKGFYCDACEKEHGPSVERTGLSNYLNETVLICDRKYFQMKDQELKASSKRSDAIKKLVRLKPKIGLEGDAGLKARIDFLKVVFVHQLKFELVTHELFDEFNIGERDYDTCFEMFDRERVVHGLVKASKANYWLKFNIQKDLGCEGYRRLVKGFSEFEEAA